MNELELKLVSPERTLLDIKAKSVTIPTPLGQITILPNHAPLVSIIKPGEVIVKTLNGEEYISVSGGFVQVRKKGYVYLLADAAEHYYEINISRAEIALARAKELLRRQQLSDQEYFATLASLERSLSRMKIAKKYASSRNSGMNLVNNRE